MSVTIGSDARNCRFFVRQSTVSGIHCRVTCDDDGQFLLEDMASTNGTYVEGRRIAAHEPVAISLGAEISLGKSVKFRLSQRIVDALTEDESAEPEPLLDDTIETPTSIALTRPTAEPMPTLDLSGRTVQAARPAPANKPATTQLSADQLATFMSEARARAAANAAASEPSTPVESTEFSGDAPPPSPSSTSLSIGYADSNDVVIPNSVVSSRHARIYLDDGRFILEDQTSTNGTWLDNQRIHRAVVQVGTVISLGSYQFVFDKEHESLLRTRNAERQTAMRRARDLSRDQSGGSEGRLRSGRTFSIGRSSSADIVIDAPMISGLHVLVTVTESEGTYYVVDQNSTNGTFLNSRDNRITAATVEPSDVIFLGSYRLPVNRISALFGGDEIRESAQSDSASKRKWTVGRDKNLVDIHIDAAVVSSRHAEIHALENGSFEIRDLSSSNGTFINGVRVRGRAIAQPTDRISFGSYEVRLDARQGVVRREYHGDIMIQADRISIQVPDKSQPGGVKRILNDISFTVYPTEFVGLMGPSGAGKTTLMMALNGYTPPNVGQSLINGVDLYQSYNAFRGTIAYVPQDDIVYPQLTVYESLLFTALLRLPPDTTRQEIDEKIDQVLRQLEIQHTRNTLIGDALKKGISGGERKRVNLAQELITGPSLLFLDEPTSGLASQDTINVMKMLRDLADQGRTIILTIHQPSLEAYRMMDSVIYLFRGNLVYYGSAYPDSILHFNSDAMSPEERQRLLSDPGNALKPLAAQQRQALSAKDPVEAQAALNAVIDQRRRDYEASRFYKEYVQDRAVPAENNASGTVKIDRRVDQTVRRGVLRQWAILSRRASLIRWKDRLNTAILLIQAPVIASVLAIVFNAIGPNLNAYFDGLWRGPKALFLLVASAIWFGCSNSAREIVAEQAIYRRERMVNLMIPSYTLSKFTVLGILCAVQCAMLLGIVYFPLEMSGDFLQMYGVLLLSALAGLGLGLTLSAVVSSAEAAMALVPMLLIPQIILGGAIMPVHEMSPAAKGLSNLMAARWGYEAMLQVEYADDDLTAIQQVCEIPECVWGAGQTGFSFRYYSGDRTQETTTEESGGLEAVVGGQIPYIEPLDHPACLSFCDAARASAEVTPLDYSFGVDSADPVRVKAQVDVPADQFTASSGDDRVGLNLASAVLGFFILFYGLLVMSLLKYRDVEVG